MKLSETYRFPLEFELVVEADTGEIISVEIVDEEFVGSTPIVWPDFVQRFPLFLVTYLKERSRQTDWAAPWRGEVAKWRDQARAERGRKPDVEAMNDAEEEKLHANPLGDTLVLRSNCPKCSSPYLNSTFIAATPDSTEYIKRHCHSCGCDWAENALDYVPPQSGERK